MLPFMFNSFSLLLMIQAFLDDLSFTYAHQKHLKEDEVNNA
jgi:hypothetical protein